MDHLLIFAWEYPGYNSKQGAALSRRIGQVANDFLRNNWIVTVVHRDNINENTTKDFFIDKSFNSKLIRIPIIGEGINNYHWFEKYKVIRKIFTFIVAFFWGDRSFKWAFKVKKILPTIELPSKPTLIISFLIY